MQRLETFDLFQKAKKLVNAEQFDEAILILKSLESVNSPIMENRVNMLFARCYTHLSQFHKGNMCLNKVNLDRLEGYDRFIYYMTKKNLIIFERDDLSSMTREKVIDSTAESIKGIQKKLVEELEQGKIPLYPRIQYELDIYELNECLEKQATLEMLDFIRDMMERYKNNNEYASEFMLTQLKIILVMVTKKLNMPKKHQIAINEALDHISKNKIDLYHLNPKLFYAIIDMLIPAYQARHIDNTYFSDAVEIKNVANLKIMYRLSKIYSAEGQDHKAEKILREIVKSHPYFTRGYTFLANFLTRSNPAPQTQKEVISIINQLFSNAKKYPLTKKTKLHAFYLLITSNRDLGNYKACRRYIDEALKVDPGSAILQSIIAKTIEAFPSKKFDVQRMHQLYDAARKADPIRYNINHPPPMDQNKPNVTAIDSTSKFASFLTAAKNESALALTVVSEEDPARFEIHYPPLPTDQPIPTVTTTGSTPRITSYLTAAKNEPIPAMAIETVVEEVASQEKPKATQKQSAYAMLRQLDINPDTNSIFAGSVVDDWESLNSDLDPTAGKYVLGVGIKN